MKLFKRVRCFFQRRIPFLRKKKKDVAAQINEGFEDDAQAYGIAEEEGEFAQDSKTEELDGPLSSEMLNEALESDKESTSNRDKFNDEEKCVERVPFPSENGMMPHGQFSSENPNEELTDAIVVTPKEIGLDEGDKVKYEEDALFSAKECMTLHGPSSKENSDESLKYDEDQSEEKFDCCFDDGEMSTVNCQLSPEKIEACDELANPNSDAPLKYDEDQSEEKFDCCFDDDEMYIVNSQLSPEKSEACDGLADPNDNSQFEVDFEGAFEQNMKEFDAKDPWYQVSSKTIENVGHSSEYHRFGFEKDNEFDEIFDFALEQYEKKYKKIDSYDDAFGCNVENPYNKRHFIEKNPIDVNYDFEYDDDSDEEIEMKKIQKKKIKVVIRDRPVKNATLQKLFLYSDVDNHMYIREIKDPLKRKDVVRSDLTGFKHVPVWDSTNMKKYYSDGDLGKPPPDFSMTFSNVQE